MTHHRVKATPENFRAYAEGVKPWSLRRNDRQYQPGDTLSVYEWAHDGGETGAEVGPWPITAVFRYYPWLPSGHVMLSLGARTTVEVARDE